MQCVLKLILTCLNFSGNGVLILFLIFKKTCIEFYSNAKYAAAKISQQRMS